MSAREVMQSFLDRVGAAVLAGDWETYRVHVRLPFYLDSETSEMAVTTEAELRVGFDQFHAMLNGLGVTDYIRLVHEAREIGPGLIEGTYESHLIAASGQRVVPPFLSTMTLRDVGGRWMGERSRARLLNPRWPIGIPLPPARSGTES